jgi:hypothetical protein
MVDGLRIQICIATASGELEPVPGGRIGLARDAAEAVVGDEETIGGQAPRLGIAGVLGR